MKIDENSWNVIPLETART